MNDKTALVTGGASGIGFGVAEALAAEKFNIAVAGRRPEKDVAENLAGLRKAGAELLYAVCDISSAEDREKMLEQVCGRFGGINVLVNNAGVAPSVRADILDATEESYERVMRINLQGPYFLTQLVARKMVAKVREGAGFSGCIVNISSISAETASVSRGEYCISKAGIAMATKLWAARLGEFGIPVYEIRPGIIETDMTAGVREKYDRLIDDGLLLQKRWGKPADIGKVVAMMARGDLAYSTGQVVYVDGGFSVSRL